MRIFLYSIFFLSFLCTAECVEKVVILGGGPAGLTAALFAGQAHLDPLVIEGSAASGQHSALSTIENFPGFPEGITGQALMQRLNLQARLFGARFSSSEAIKLDLQRTPFHIELQDGSSIEAEALIIATGASPRWLGVPREEKWIGKAISANALQDGARYKNQEVVVVGGGDSAMEQALLLTEYASKVSLLSSGKTLTGVQYLQERVLAHPKIFCLFEIEVKGLREKENSLMGVEIMQKGVPSYYPCRAIFVAQGRRPNTDLLKGQLELTETGHVVTLPDSTLTSIPGVFIAGDIAKSAYRKMVTSAASGCMAALDAGKFLKTKPTPS